MKNNFIEELFKGYEGEKPQGSYFDELKPVGREILEEDMTPYEKLVNGNKAKTECVDFRWDQKGTELL